eukprot:Rhum_TRINITY_DN12131_c1_g1::Rhum_TRINITY_DN12131_c1_g1_i1::g.49649::m.49649/K01110/PTEN; phosphatidylinositol-3,4,5-trisphosphate 3-phosphatase and dual-specificity protein phosphatase PTEN
MFGRSKKKKDDSPAKAGSVSPGGSPTSGGGGNAFTKKMRGMVSMKKVRYTEDGYDLDLTYITPRVIAMGFPSHGAEGLYRNPVDEVERFFNTKYGGRYRIYNLCSERDYDSESRFAGAWKCFPFDDHNAPAPIRILCDFIEDVKEFLAKSDQNVVAVHCKAGKGRTGVVLAAYLMATDVLYRDPQAAMTRFASLRTSDGKGVTIPSQQRYVRYWSTVLEKYGGTPPPSPPIKIDGITLKGGSKGWDLYVVVEEGPERMRGSASQVFDSRPKFGFKTAVAGNGSFSFDLSPYELVVRGDVRFIFKASRRVGSDDHLFHIWLHTCFTADGLHTFPKMQLDRASKDEKHEKFKSELTVTITTAPAPVDSRRRGDSAFFSTSSSPPASPPPAAAATAAASPAESSAGNEDGRSTTHSPPPPRSPTPPQPPVETCPFPSATGAGGVEAHEGNGTADEPLPQAEAAAPRGSGGEAPEEEEEEEEKQPSVKEEAEEAADEEPVQETEAEKRLRELREQREQRQRDREAEKAKRNEERKEAEARRQREASEREAAARGEAERRQRERDEKRRQRDQERAARRGITTGEDAASASPSPSPSSPASPAAAVVSSNDTQQSPSPVAEEDPLAALYNEAGPAADTPTSSPSPVASPAAHHVDSPSEAPPPQPVAASAGAEEAAAAAAATAAASATSALVAPASTPAAAAAAAK